MNPTLRIVRFASAILFGLLGGSKVWFLAAGATKNAFLPWWALGAAGAVELGIGALLLTRRWRTGALLALLLGVAFIVALSVMLLLEIDPARCGCFGSWKIGARGHVLVACGICCLAGMMLVDRAPLPGAPASAAEA